MAKKEILQKTDPVLGKKSHPITAFDQKLHHLLRDMHDTLEAAGGAGLAAVQIGILRRVVLVVDDEDTVLELINPEIIAQSEETQDGLEGCLSLSGRFGFVVRPMEVTVKAQDRDGNYFTRTGREIVARCFCHELEHLDGHMFDEHTDRLYTDAEIEELQEEAERQERRNRRKGQA